MRTVRVFAEAIPTSDEPLALSGKNFQHLIKVLRLTQGDTIEVFDGRGKRALCTLINVSKRSAEITFLETLTPNSESPLSTHLGLVMSKGDRFDYALQKATELGVNSVTPLTSERCDLKLNAERSEKKFQHWQGILQSACEQCYRDVVPTLEPIQSLTGWAEKQRSSLKLVLHTTAENPVLNELDQPETVSLLIGPEGGLTSSEVAQAKRCGFLAWQLGPRILRTETAPVAILAILQSRWGDM